MHFGVNLFAECFHLVIDSIAAAQKLRGCTIIRGTLEIQVRGGGEWIVSFLKLRCNGLKSDNRFLCKHSINSGCTTRAVSGQVVRELEENLGSIEEVTEAVKIVHSYAVMSLNFLKNLRVIRGENLIKNRSVLMSSRLITVRGVLSVLLLVVALYYTYCLYCVVVIILCRLCSDWLIAACVCVCGSLIGR